MPRSANPATKAKAPAPLLAWHSDASLKNATVAEMAAHREADRLVKGVYWENGRGCAVGCLIHGSFSVRKVDGGVRVWRTA